MHLIRNFELFLGRVFLLGGGTIIHGIPIWLSIVVAIIGGICVGVIIYLILFQEFDGKYYSPKAILTVRNDFESSNPTVYVFCQTSLVCVVPLNIILLAFEQIVVAGLFANRAF